MLMVLMTNKLYGIPCRAVELLEQTESLEDIVGVQAPSSLVYLVSQIQ